jgi:phage tail protein X
MLTPQGEYTEYITQQGDTWDFIAWSEYGNEALLEIIIVANPHVPISALLPSGLLLAIPRVTEVRPSVSNAQRPPWRQR